MARRFGKPFKGGAKRKALSSQRSSSAKVRNGGPAWSSREFNRLAGGLSRGGTRR